MRAHLTIVVLTIAGLVGTTANSQTPDGQTPAEETVCDPLRADGITKGLYGLCVAFCEAQDYAELATPITDAELAILETNAPAGRILENYNKKKQATDPAMPCILVEEPCPCWSAEELASIDGFNPDGISLPTFFCQEIRDPTTMLTEVRRVREDSNIPALNRHWATTWDVHRPGTTFEQCDYLDLQVRPIIFRVLSVQTGTLTHEQAGVCLEQVNARCDALGF